MAAAIEKNTNERAQAGWELVTFSVTNSASGIEESLLLAILAKSICEPAHLHIWDRLMNYIDVISRMQVEELLVQFQPTILFAEHDKAFCENAATEIVAL